MFIPVSTYDRYDPYWSTYETILIRSDGTNVQIKKTIINHGLSYSYVLYHSENQLIQANKEVKIIMY